MCVGYSPLKVVGRGDFGWLSHFIRVAVANTIIPHTLAVRAPRGTAACSSQRPSHANSSSTFKEMAMNTNPLMPRGDIIKVAEISPHLQSYVQLSAK